MAITIIAFAGILFSAASPYLPRGLPLWAFVSLIVIISIFFLARVMRLSNQIESLFLETFSDGARSMEGKRGEIMRRKIEARHPWPIRLMEAVVSEGSHGAGKRIRELNMRSEGGAMVLAICRGGHTFFDPGPEVPLFPGDRVMLLGDEQQAREAAELISGIEHGFTGVDRVGSIRICQVHIEESSPLHGETLAGGNLRRRFGVSIIGIERNEERIISPAASEILQSGDLLLLAGSADATERFAKELDCTITDQLSETIKGSNDDDPPHLGHALD